MGFTGKLPPEVLESIVYGRLGLRDPAVAVGPSYGEDAAVIEAGWGRVIVAHSDPVTAAERYAGWLAVNVAANDVAAQGARPRWFLTVILLPEDSGPRLLEEIASQADRAARGIGAMIVGGHTEAAPGLGRPIVVATAMGLAPRESVARTSGARPGDLVIMTKTAAVEGTAILASDYRGELARRGVPRDVLARAEGFIWRVSVVPEALALAGRGLVDAMHDPTEGGILGGAAEVAYASGVRVRLYEDRVPVAPETRVVAGALGVDPLRLISSGSLLAAVPRGLAGEALEALRGLGVDVAVVGEVLDSKRPGLELVRRDGSRVEVPRHVPDEIYRLPPPGEGGGA